MFTFSQLLSDIRSQDSKGLGELTMAFPADLIVHLRKYIKIKASLGLDCGPDVRVFYMSTNKPITNTRFTSAMVTCLEEA